jgi:raffinose synthase
MKIKNYFLKALIISLVLIVSGCISNNSKSKIIMDAVDEGIDFYYGGKKRLSGGMPKLEKNGSVYTINQLSSESFSFGNENPIQVEILSKSGNIFGIYISLPKDQAFDGRNFAGFFFDSIPGFMQGVEIWRYKPWNSWTKPIKILSPAEIHDWDVQFFYWQYSDGLYGAAIPLSGNGFRSTLGADEGRFGAKTLTHTQHADSDSIPLMAVGFGDNPHTLFADLYREAFQMMGKSENLRENKKYPEPFEYIGWCTWNSSHNGRDLNETHLLEGVATFTDHNFPLGWLLIDDGWFNQTEKQLNSYLPDSVKFPKGFQPVVAKLKEKHGLQHVGIWHAFNGYWNGINPASQLGTHFKNELYEWRQPVNAADSLSPAVACHFLKPTSDSLLAFYQNWHKYFAQQGFSFVKVDNQLVSERMSANTYPIWDVAENLHKALYSSVFEFFDGAVINCMNMTNDAFYNFGESAIARCVEDYFPERDGGTGYRLEYGGPAAHVLSALYNSLYFSQFVWPDFDMFESHNTYAHFHAAARAISGGPVYLTDRPGEQDFNVLWPLIDHSGRIIRADKPALLTRDCLFQVQENKPLKAFSFAGNAGLLAVFNAADADLAVGDFSTLDIEGLEGKSFAAYEFFSGEMVVLNAGEKHPISLNRMECKYYNLVPITDGVAIIGLVNKYNAPKMVLSSVIGSKQIEVALAEGGTFKALLPRKPVSVSVNNQNVPFSFIENVLTIEIDTTKNEMKNVIIK